MGYGLIEIKHESTTINIGHLVDSAKLEMSTFNKTYSGLIGKSSKCQTPHILNVTAKARRKLTQTKHL